MEGCYAPGDGDAKAHPDAAKRDDITLHVAAVMQTKQGHYSMAQQILQRALSSYPENHMYRARVG